MTDEELDARFIAIRVDIRNDIRDEGVRTRRHFDVVAEGLRADIRIIAEGHDVLRQDVGDLKAGQQRLEAGQGRLEIRQEALEFRQGRLEDRQTKLEDRQTRLEERQAGLEDRQERLEQGQQDLKHGMGRLEGRQESLEASQHNLVTEVRLLTARLVDTSR